MKNKLFIIPMLATLLLAACSNETSTTISETTEGNSQVVTGGGTTEKVPTSSSQTSTEEIKTSESSWATPSIPDKDPDKPNLPCGQEYLPLPDNAADPIVLPNEHTPVSFLSTDCIGDYMPENFKYINGNNALEKASGAFVVNTTKDWKYGGLTLDYKDGSPIKGIQTPMWDAWTEDSANVEVSFKINYFQGASKRPDKTRKPIIFYGFDETGKLVYQETKDNLRIDKVGHDQNTNASITLDLNESNPNAKKVRYVELRLVNSLWDTSGKQAKPVIKSATITRFIHK